MFFLHLSGNNNHKKFTNNKLLFNNYLFFKIKF